MIDRYHLSIIREVDRLGSQTAAADALNVTQSALSHAIKKLESQIGTNVWEKEGRSLRLTKAGSFILDLANRLLPQFDHAEEILSQIAMGRRGKLSIGMECHPCYQWLSKVVSPYLKAWPDVDVDVKQDFLFGGIKALLGYDIDLLLTPDPLHKSGLIYAPVFDYEQVLVVSHDHALANAPHVLPGQLMQETLLTYPVEVERLDIFRDFLLPAGIFPKRHKTMENTEIMLQMVAAGRGVTALPRWRVENYSPQIPVQAIRLGQHGVTKQVFLGMRKVDVEIDYMASFLELAKKVKWPS